MSRLTLRRGFTLVEMLVVIGIIAVLAALLLPAVMSAITRARNAVIALEVKQLDTAIEAYRLEKGDYPPNFRDETALTRHLAKCYPRIDPGYAAAFIYNATRDPPTNPAIPNVFIDEGESLVFWLSMTDSNPQFPFLSYLNPNPNKLTPNPKKYYDFEQTRLTKPGSDEEGTRNTPDNITRTFYDVPSYQAKFAKETNYIYIDSRSYMPLTVNFSATPPNPNVPYYAYSEDPSVGVRPYWTKTKNTAKPTATLDREEFKAVNPTTFQIICAGQDGDWGNLATDLKYFPTGENYDDGDKDNIGSFSSGRTLGDSIP
jgi:type II secretion system protein G